MKKFFFYLIKQKKIFFSLIFIFCSFIFVNLALAQDTPSVYSFGLNIAIPGADSTYTVGSNMLGNYINAWYQFLLGVIGIIATVMIMIGGFKYLSSQGDKGQIQEAQNIIISAITGLLLAFGSVAILNLINPKLLTLEMPTIPGIQYSGTYDKIDRPVRLGGNTAETNGTPREPGDVPSEKLPPTGETLEKFIAREEGDPALAPKKDICCTYDAGCPGGGCQWYLGYGHACGNTDRNSTVPPAGCASSITQEQADAWLAQDIEKAENIARGAVGEETWNNLSDGRQGVLTDMAYVMGGSLNNFNNTLGAVRNGDWEAASYGIRNSQWGRNQASNRAARNAWIMRHGYRPQ